MATTPEQLRVKHAAKTKEAQTLLDKPDLTTADYDAAKSITEIELPELEKQIEMHAGGADALKTKLAASEAWNNAPAGGAGVSFKSAGYAQIENDGKQSSMFQSGAGLLSSAQMKTIQNPDYADAFEIYTRKGDIDRMSGPAIKTLSEGKDEDGGFLVPAEMLERIIERKPTLTRVAGAVTSLTTSRDALIIPRVNYSADDIFTTGLRVNWVGEGGGAGEANNPKFGTQRFNVFTAMMELNITNDLLDDAGFPLMDWAAGKMHETTKILRDQMSLLGTGNGQPYGMLARVGNGPDQIKTVKSGAAADITADALMNMAYAIPEQYMENCRWLMNRTDTERRLATLKDGAGRYLFATGREADTLANARPDELLAFMLMRSALMPNVAANSLSILFGDLTGYYQIERLGFSIQMLREVEARNNKTVMLGRLRMGGDVAEAWKLRAMKTGA